VRLSEVETWSYCRRQRSSTYASETFQIKGPLPNKIKKDVLNVRLNRYFVMIYFYFLKFIRTELTLKHNLPIKPRERFTATAKDIEYLLRGLFSNDCHDYRHERARA
jgi:hypothetical protein